MNLNDFTQYFDNPAVSIFDRSQSKKLPVDIGPLYPLKWDLLSFGNSAKGNSAHSLRMNPMVVPTYTNMKVSEHTAIVPLRTIMNDYEQKFNYAKNTEGAVLPSFTVDQYVQVLKAMLSVGISPVGSLFDYMGYPVFGDLYNALDWSSFKSRSGGVEAGLFDPQAFSYFYTISSNSFELKSQTAQLTFIYRDTTRSVTEAVPFIIFLAFKTFYPNLNPYEYYAQWELGGAATLAVQSFYQGIIGGFVGAGTLVPSGNNDIVPTNDQMIASSIYPTMQAALEDYQNYLFGLALSKMFASIDLVSQSYTTLPLRAYFRFHYDWNTNGNFTDRDVLLDQNVFGYEGKLGNLASIILNGSTDETILKQFSHLVLPVNRLWNDDYFTSLLPTSAVDNAVEIPANSTVLDLAKLTAWQKFVMKLSYSSRYRDVVWNIFKIKPSDARLQQSYPIFRKYHNIGVGETIQTSSDSPAGVLGSFAGRAYSSGRTKGYHIFCEEPCVLLDFVSITPEAVYADALHPLIHVDDILDFPIPDMDVLGNQPIMADMVSGNPVDRDVVLGYGRQYQEWLSNYNTVHGDYKTSLDYWVLTRRFEDTPVINDDFLRIHPADDLNKIFAVPSAKHANLDIYYNARVTRHVHRNVRIKI